MNGSSVTFFRGFLIQPRLAADDTTVVGLFMSPDTEAEYKLSSCMDPAVCNIVHA